MNNIRIDFNTRNIIRVKNKRYKYGILYMELVDTDKLFIINLFNNNVKGKEPCGEGMNEKHCGKEGYWLETQMNIIHNSKNEPDICGYEMKKSSNKISLGDYSANEYAFSGKNKRNHINSVNNWTDEIRIKRYEFIMYFGNPNLNKNNRYSWSGTSFPKYGDWNENGQTLVISPENDILIYYSFSKDSRDTKSSFPEYLQKDDVLIAVWKNDKMNQNINSKFNKKGFFMCKKTGNTYTSICFGKPFDVNYFIESIKNRKVILDSGMYQGNSRNYSTFRGGQSFWNDLITEEYS